MTATATAPQKTSESRLVPKLEVIGTPTGSWAIQLMIDGHIAADEIGPSLAEQIDADPDVRAFRAAAAKHRDRLTSLEAAQKKWRDTIDARERLIDYPDPDADKIVAATAANLNAKSVVEFEREACARLEKEAERLKSVAGEATDRIAKQCLKTMRAELEDRRNGALDRLRRKAGSELAEILAATLGLFSLTDGVHFEPPATISRVRNRGRRMLTEQPRE